MQIDEQAVKKAIARLVAEERAIYAIVNGKPGIRLIKREPDSGTRRAHGEHAREEKPE